MEQFLMQTYTIALPVILTALMGYIVWLLKNQKKDRDANSKGTMLLLRVQLIEYHDRYMARGDIPSYAYENFMEMYDAYHEAANQNEALIADVGKRFYEEADKQYIFAEDGCHPNELGSRLAAQVIADVILADQATKTEIVIEPKAEDNDTRLRILYLYQMLLT